MVVEKEVVCLGQQPACPSMEHGPLITWTYSAPVPTAQPQAGASLHSPLNTGMKVPMLALRLDQRIPRTVVATTISGPVMASPSQHLSSPRDTELQVQCRQTLCGPQTDQVTSVSKGQEGSQAGAEGGLTG